MTYTGTNPILLALTPTEIADLETNSPHQTITQDQFNCWCVQAYFERHLFDRGADSNPFGG